MTKHRLPSFFSSEFPGSSVVTCRLSPDARHSQCDISPLGKKPGPQIKRPKNCKGKVRERDGEREDRIEDKSQIIGVSATAHLILKICLGMHHLFSLKIIQHLH